VVRATITGVGIAQGGDRVAGEDEIEISATLRDAMSAAITPISRRLDQLEERFEGVGRAAKKAGGDAESGLGKATESTEDLGKASRRARPPVRELGDETVKTGAKARAGSAGLDEFAKKADKAGLSSRRSGRMIVNAFKFTGVITGVFALAGGVSALGAGGAIAVGGLAPLVGVLGLVPPLLLAVKLGMWATKLAAEQLEQPLTRIKNQFVQLGPQIAAGGLRAGFDYLADSMVALSQVSGRGLTGIGAEVGDLARELGKLARTPRFLGQVEIIFLELRPVVRDLGRGVLYLAQAMMNLIQAALPAVNQFAAIFLDIARGLANWTRQVLDNGKASQFFVYSLRLLARVTGVLVDFIIGLYNVFRIAAGYSIEFGLSIEALAWKFRLWTRSAEGQQQISQYFRDSLPALREMGLLLGMIVGGMARLGASQNVAPLLQQIRTEFAPALGELVAKLSGQGGLGPALITATTALVQLFASLDFSGLTAFMIAIAQLAQGITWLATNVPGANFVLSTLLVSMLGFKVLGPVFSLLGGGAKAFSWVFGALRGVQGLSMAQMILKSVVLQLWLAFKMVGAGIVAVVRMIGIAFMANPVGIVIAIIIGLVMLLWFKCEWFRDAVTAAWQWIAKAAVVAWDWIVNAVKVAIDWIVEKSMWLWNNGLKPVWEIISTGVRWYIMAWVFYVKTVIAVISTVVMWLWENVIKPVWGFISGAAEIAWNVIKFIVQTVVFLVAVYITIMAKAAEAAWNLIATVGRWVWENVIAPVVQWFVGIFTTAMNWVSKKWDILVLALKIAWGFFVAAISAAVAWIQEKWSIFTTALGAAWRAFYVIYVQPVINFIKISWEMLTGFLQEKWSFVSAVIGAAWDGLSLLVGNVINSIKLMWDRGVSWLRDTFQPVGDFIGKVWDGISTGAEKAAGIVQGVWSKAVSIVKGAWNALAGTWNGVPSITVPDWVPGMGGKQFSLPKLPMLWHGGQVAGGGKAIVGEHGPEPLVKNGRLLGMLGMNGPQVADIPRGGYVVPNLSTLNSLPGLTKTLPAGVAAAVARSVPGYAGALRGGAPRGDGLQRSVDRLARAMAGQMPPVTVNSTGDIEDAVYKAWKKFRREEETKGRYNYTAGGR
jgi:phage-related protein